MPSGAAEADEPALLLLQQRLQGLGLRQPGAEQEESGGETELRDDEDDDEEDEALLLPSPLLLPPGLDVSDGHRGMMAATPFRTKSVNTTECVPVPSSEHVAEIVGRQGCKIKALRAQTNTYIRTPARGSAPVFVVTGRRRDVAAARRQILSAAEHFSLLRASRGRAGPAPPFPGQATARVRVPYRLVGLVVGPKGATIKRIQRQTHTYIVTPGRDQEPVFQVTGTPENVGRAREEIQTHIARRAAARPEAGGDGGGDFRRDGAGAGFGGGVLPCSSWLGARPPVPGTGGGYGDGSSSSLGSGSTDSCLGGLADFSPSSPFGAGGFWFGEGLPGAEELLLDSPGFEPLPVPSPVVWAPFEPAASLPGLAGTGAPRPPTPRLSPAEDRRTRSGSADPAGYGFPTGMAVHVPAFSAGASSYSSSNGGSACSSPPESRQRRCGRAGPACAVCRGDAARAGHA